MLLALEDGESRRWRVSELLVTEDGAEEVAFPLLGSRRIERPSDHLAALANAEWVLLAIRDEHEAGDPADRKAGERAALRAVRRRRLVRIAERLQLGGAGWQGDRSHNDHQRAYRGEGDEIARAPGPSACHESP